MSLLLLSVILWISTLIYVCSCSCPFVTLIAYKEFHSELDLLIFLVSFKIHTFTINTFFPLENLQPCQERGYVELKQNIYLDVVSSYVEEYQNKIWSQKDTFIFMQLHRVWSGQMMSSSLTSSDSLYYFSTHVNVILPEIQSMAILLPSEFKKYEIKGTYLKNRNRLTDLENEFMVIMEEGWWEEG